MPCRKTTQWFSARLLRPDRGVVVSEPDAALTSVVVVNYDAGPLLARCVRSVLSSATPVEVIVVDNASADDSLSTLRAEMGLDPRLRIVENDANLGFARACNQGLALARGDQILFFNPDAVLPPHAIAGLRAALDDVPSAGMAGPLLVHPDGQEQRGCRRDLPSLSNTFALALGLPRGLRRRIGSDLVRSGEPLPEGPAPVQAISGACMLVTRQAIDRVGPLDQRYFLHCEDLDWCARFRAAGLTVLFVPGVRVVHDMGVSSRCRPLFVLWHKHRGMLRYYHRFLRPQHHGFVAMLVAVGVWLRFLAAATLSLGSWPLPPRRSRSVAHRVIRHRAGALERS
jgi:GT2 family glycosyltransferase